MKKLSINLLNILIICFLFGTIFLTGCGKKGCTDPASLNYDADAKEDDGSCVYDTGYTVPTTYNFNNVNHAGQTVRLLLLGDLVTKIAEAGTGTVIKADLIAIYENTNNSYSSIASGKKLKDKVATTAIDSTILDYFTQIESLSAAGKSYVTDSGIDLKQMVEKTLMGSIFWYQALSYLNLVPDDDNETVTAGDGTDMEHHFDEAFGYFGAASDYNNYTDSEIKNPSEKDSDGDGTIDPITEKCLYYSTTAAKRDLGALEVSATSTINYTKAIFDAFLDGRAAISNIDYPKRNTAITAIKDNWEEIIAATVIHYINELKSNISTGSTDLNKHWAELTGYFNMIPYRTDNKIGSANTSTINNYFGSKPADATATSLDAAAKLIQNAYGFTDELVAGW